MKKISLFLLFGLIAINLLSNSCKKNSDENHIDGLLSGGVWQLASVQVTNYIGDSQVSLDTLNDSCKFTQFFTFRPDNTCTYTNFDCVGQSATGKWSLTPNKLFLLSDILCKDTTAAGSSKPFDTTEIYNLGTYSLVLQTGDIQPNYSATKKRRIIRYGFIRQKDTTSISN